MSDKTDLSHRATVLLTRISKQQSGTTKVNKKVQHTSPVSTTPKAVVSKVEQLSDSNLSLVLDFPSVHSIQSIETAAVIVKSEQPDSTMSIDEQQCGRRSKRTRSRAKAQPPVATSADTAATTNTATVTTTATTTAAAPGMDGSAKVDIVSDSVEPLQVLYVINMLPISSSSASSSSGSGSSLEESNRDVPTQPLLEFISNFLTLTIVNSVTSNTKQEHQQLEHTTSTVTHFSDPITTTTNATSV